MVLSLEPGLAQHQLQPLYDSLFQTGNLVVHGKEHKGQYPPGKGHPFFDQQNWRSGYIEMLQMSLAYDAIRYDLLNDHLLIQHFSESGSHVVIVNRDYAREFQLDGHHFFFLEMVEGDGSGLEPGYYEAGYGSGTEIWIRWKKSFSEGSQGSGQYELSTTHYIKNNNSYFRITNRKSLLRAFPEREDEIKSYLKKQKISVSRADTEQLAGIVSYYVEQLK